MPTSLAEALSVVEERLPRDFFDEARLAALLRWARNAPPVPWAGFECPLGAERWVDFHQGFHREDLPHLTAWLQHKVSDAEGDGAWIAPLLKFCAEWGRADSLFFRTIPNLIFEYDVRDHPERISSPSIFIALERVDGDDDSPAGESITPVLKRAAIQSALALFLDPARVAMLMRGIDRCLSSAPINASISHLGLMLSRKTSAVRINVRSLHYDQFAPFLAAIGWSGAREQLEEALAESYAFAERINLAIDVGEQIGAAIGLECSTYVYNPMRWEFILRNFVATSICTEEQQRGLSKWWGRQAPSSDPMTWPANLIAQGLLQNSDRFSVIDRYISHFKMTWQPDGLRQFKCYLGFDHRFTTRPHPSMRDPRPNPYPRPLDRIASAPAADQLEDAISRGIDFLLRNRLHSGLWLDFPSVSEDDSWIAFGTSDEWVSVYVARALAEFEREDTRRAAAWVWRVLSHRRKGAGWGYSCISPADADSTVWGLRLAQALKVSDTPPALSARDFLRRHQHDNGGLATYLPDAAIRYFAELVTSEINAWCEPHVCVTAAAAHLPELQAECFRFLRASQKGDGRWDSYWWTDSEYSTGLATAALAQSRAEDDRVRITSAVTWAMARVGADGGVHSAGCKADTPFSTAWNLRTLLAAPADPQARALALKSLQWLLHELRADGSWSGSAWMKTPPVNSSSKLGTLLAQDRNGNFTTASVLSSLRIARAIR